MSVNLVLEYTYVKKCRTYLKTSFKSTLPCNDSVMNRHAMPLFYIHRK